MSVTVVVPKDDCLYGDTEAGGLINIDAVNPIQYQASTGKLSILEASNSQIGIVTLDAQTLAGTKTFTSVPLCNTLPTSSNQLINKAYADNLSYGISWQIPILAFWDASSALPSNPTSGNRYICSVAGNGWLLDYIYTYTTSWSGSAPSEGWTVYNDDTNNSWNYNGSAWVRIGASIDHNDLINRGTLTHATIDSYLNQSVKTTAQPTFNETILTTGTNGNNQLTLNFNDGVYNTNSIFKCNNAGNMTITPAGGTTQHMGTYQVQSTTNNQLVVAYDAADAVTLSVANNGDATLTATDGDSQTNNNLYINSKDILHVNCGIDTTDTLTGSLIVSGGEAIAKSLFVGGNVNITSTATVNQTLTNSGALVVNGGATINGYVKKIYSMAHTMSNTANHWLRLFDPAVTPTTGMTYGVINISDSTLGAFHIKAKYTINWATSYLSCTLKSDTWNANSFKLYGVVDGDTNLFHVYLLSNASTFNIKHTALKGPPLTFSFLDCGSSTTYPTYPSDCNQSTSTVKYDGVIDWAANTVLAGVSCDDTFGYHIPQSLNIHNFSGSALAVSLAVSTTGDLTCDCSGNDFNFANTDIVHVLSTTDASGNTTGALVVSGGVGITKKLYVAGDTKITSVTESSGTTTGSLVLSGGLGIAKNLHVGGTLYTDGFLHSENVENYSMTLGVNKWIRLFDVLTSGASVGHLHFTKYQAFDIWVHYSINFTTPSASICYIQSLYNNAASSTRIAMISDEDNSEYIHFYFANGNNNYTIANYWEYGTKIKLNLVDCGDKSLTCPNDITNYKFVYDTNGLNWGNNIIYAGMSSDFSGALHLGQTTYMHYGTAPAPAASFTVASDGDLTCDCAGNDFYHANTDIVHILSTNDTTDTTTGALIVSGGVNIGKTAIINITTNATSQTTGALIVNGGIGANGLIYSPTIQSFTTSPPSYANGSTLTAAHLLAGFALFTSLGGAVNAPTAANLWTELGTTRQVVGYWFRFMARCTGGGLTNSMVFPSGYTVYGGLTGISYWFDLLIIVTGSSTYNVYVTTQ